MNTGTAATRRCAIYVRISVALEASVSIDRQIEAAEQYAAARGWQVVGAFRDEGVSATHNKPQDRDGWRALLESPEQFDAVIIWKLDRLARRVLDFHLANQALSERGAGLVAVENAIDMTTPDGRMIAGVLANFAEYEAESIAARVRAARTHLLRAQRVVGGTVPYGWRSVPNPDGPGLVLAQDSDRIGVVREMVDRTLAGDTLYSTKKWLDESGTPSPTGREGWAYSTVERILRHPILAGMTPFNPGNATKQRGSEVLRDADGLPVVDESVAVMTPDEWRKMLRDLDGRDSPQARPRATKSKTSALLSGLLWCEDCDQRMHRGNVNGRDGYHCPQCFQAISNFEDVLVAEFLRQKGEHTRWSVVEEVHEGGATLLPEIENRLSELSAELQPLDDDDPRAVLLKEQIRNLKALRKQKRAEAPVVTMRETRSTQDFADDWAEAETVAEQREILDDAMSRVWIRRGGRGRQTEAKYLARMRIDWKFPDHLGPLVEHTL